MRLSKTNPGSLQATLLFAGQSHMCFCSYVLTYVPTSFHSFSSSFYSPYLTPDLPVVATHEQDLHLVDAIREREVHLLGAGGVVDGDVG